MRKGDSRTGADNPERSQVAPPAEPAAEPERQAAQEELVVELAALVEEQQRTSTRVYLGGAVLQKASQPEGLSPPPALVRAVS